MRRAWVPAVALVVLVAIGCGVDLEAEKASVEMSAVEDPVATTELATTTSTTTTTTTTAPATTTTTTTAPTVTVTRVVDGDTLEVSTGDTVRLIGIDTPERGECGYDEATNLLRLMVDQKPVSLVPGAQDDRDRYGRILRYVEVDGGDVNLELISSGRAVARYDSRDGYGRHPREDQYVAADATSDNAVRCAPATTAPPATTPPQPASPAPSAGGNDPRFGTCKDAISNGYGPYRRGIDPEYNWYRDGDHDGTNCER